MTASAATQIRLARIGMSRRQFLGRGGALLGGLAIAPAVLAACGGSSGSVERSGWRSKSVSISNWTSYIDRRSRRRTSRRTPGIKLTYTRGHQRQQRVLRQDPAEPEPGPEHRARRLRAHRLDGEPHDQPGEVDPAASIAAAFPNKANLRAAARAPAFDPTRKFSAPWASGVTGIAYNIEDRPARRSRRSTTSSPSRARRRCSPRCATPSASSCGRCGNDTDAADLRQGASRRSTSSRRRSTTARSTASTATST